MVDASAVAKDISSKLRGYDGLTPEKLARCDALLEALGTPDPMEALNRFTHAIDRLPVDKFTDALKNALRLDDGLPESLTGARGRRALYGLQQTVSEETVKLWESKAINTLTRMLLAQSYETLREVAVTFFIEDNRIVYEWVARFWQHPDNKRTRLESSEFANTRKLSMTFGAYQLGSNEQPADIEIYLIFNKHELPKGTFGVGGTDIFGFITGNYQRDKVDGPYDAVDLMGGLTPELAEGLTDKAGYVMRWYKPKPLEIYAIAWF